MSEKLPGKPKRPRRAYDLEDLYHAAIARRASRLSLDYRRKVSVSEALAIVLKEALAREIAELTSDEAPAKKRKPTDTN